MLYYHLVIFPFYYYQCNKNLPISNSV